MVLHILCIIFLEDKYTPISRRLIIISMYVRVKSHSIGSDVIFSGSGNTILSNFLLRFVDLDKEDDDDVEDDVEDDLENDVENSEGKGRLFSRLGNLFK